MAVHPTAACGFQTAAASYERARPGYPDSAVKRLRELFGADSGSRVLDLACGTGKLTRAIAAGGGWIVGADPVDGMLRELQRAGPGIPLVESAAERLPFGAATLDAVTVAQAFHWFDGDSALAEIHRVLRPGGTLALIWNVRDTSEPWVARMGSIFERYERDVATLRFWRGAWREAFERTELFAPLEREDFAHAQTLTRGGVIERVLSVSFIATLPPDERDAVAAEVASIVEDEPATQGRDRVTLPYVTQLYWCRRIP